MRAAADSPPLPALSYPLLAGGTWSSASARGHVVVLDVWATYCAPCREAFPRLDRLAHDHPEVVVIGLSVDEADAEVQRFLRGVPVGFTIARDPTLTISRPPMQVVRLPTLIVVDRVGRVRLRRADATAADYDALPGLVAQLAAERYSPGAHDAQ